MKPYWFEETKRCKNTSYLIINKWQVQFLQIEGDGIQAYLKNLEAAIQAGAVEAVASYNHKDFEI